MNRLVIALASLTLAVGCGAKSTSSTTPGEGSGPAPLAKHLSISWGFSPAGDTTEVYLATTDETGKQVSHEIGRYKGTCSVVAPAAEMHALTGARCITGGVGTELHVVQQGGDQIIILKAAWNEGAPVDPMARDEVTRITVPLGIAIHVDPVAATTGAPGTP